MPRCPYCKSLHNSWEGLDEHRKPCRRRWIKQRGLARKREGKPPLSDKQKAALIEQGVFKGFMEEENG